MRGWRFCVGIGDGGGVCLELGWGIGGFLGVGFCSGVGDEMVGSGGGRVGFMGSVDHVEWLFMQWWGDL